VRPMKEGSPRVPKGKRRIGYGEESLSANVRVVQQGEEGEAGNEAWDARGGPGWPSAWTWDAGGECGEKLEKAEMMIWTGEKKGERTRKGGLIPQLYMVSQNEERGVS